MDSTSMLEFVVKAMDIMNSLMTEFLDQVSTAQNWAQSDKDGITAWRETQTEMKLLVRNELARQARSGLSILAPVGTLAMDITNSLIIEFLEYVSEAGSWAQSDKDRIIAWREKQTEMKLLISNELAKHDLGGLPILAPVGTQRSEHVAGSSSNIARLLEQSSELSVSEMSSTPSAGELGPSNPLMVYQRRSTSTISSIGLRSCCGTFLPDLNELPPPE